MCFELSAHAPYCTIYGLKRLAIDLGAKYPQAQEFIQNNYVDDSLVSTDSE